MQSGVVVFGGLVAVGGVVIVLLRGNLGRFAHGYWSAVGSKRAVKSERYWVEYSLATGVIVAVVGAVVSLVGLFGSSA